MNKLPPEMIDTWRAQARRVLADITAPTSQKQLAWRFLKQWGLS